MVQIAVTDLLVCAIWIIMTSIIASSVINVPNEGVGLIGKYGDTIYMFDNMRPIEPITLVNTI